MSVNQKIRQGLLALALCALPACSATAGGPATDPAPASSEMAAADSRHYNDVDELLDPSDAAALVQITASSPTTVQGIEMTLYQATVLGSEPIELPTNLEVVAIPDNGTAETIDLAEGNTYVLFLSGSGPAHLVSPSQGVFPVDGNVAGPSRDGTFDLGPVASSLGLG